MAERKQKMIRTLLGRSINFVTTYNKLTLVVMILMTGVVMAGIPQLETTTNPGGGSGGFDDVDQVQKSEVIQQQYQRGLVSASDSSVFLVSVWEESGNVLSRESLLTGLRYQREIRSTDSVESLLDDEVIGIENIVATRLAGEQNVSLDRQIGALENASPTELRAAVGAAVQQPAAKQYLPADHDGTVTATDRRLAIQFELTDNFTRLEDAGRTVQATSNEYSAAGFFMPNGDSRDDYNDHFFAEMFELVLPIALVLILGILAFTYRDPVDVVVGMSGVVLSVLWMFGLLGWLGVEAGTASVVPVVLITGLSIDFGFHVFNRYREQRGAADGVRRPMARGVRLVSTALLLVTVTAAIGFLSNLANPSGVVRNLGVSITLGVISSLVLFLTVVPVLKISIDGLLERVGLDRRKEALGRGRYLAPALRKGVALAQRAAPVVLVVAVVVGAASGLAWASLDEESYRQPDGDVAEWKQQLPGPVGWDSSEQLARDIHVEDVYDPVRPQNAVRSRILVEGNVTDHETLVDIERGVDAVADEGLLVNENSELSPVTAMQRVARENDSFGAAFEQADTDDDGIPDQNVKQLYDEFYATDTKAAATVIERRGGEYRSVLVTLALTADRSEANDVVPKLDEASVLMEGNGERTATAAGSLATSEAIVQEIVDAILLTMILALAAIIVTLTVVFRGIHGTATLGFVVSIPIVLVVGLVIGGMSLLNIPLTLLTALLMSLVIGLGVDYNIHIGDRFADELSAGNPPIRALESAVTGTGGALLGSTLTSTSAFATLALVPHPQLETFGKIVVIALLTSFLVSVLVLPSLLVLWDRYLPAEVSRSESDVSTQD